MVVVAAARWLSSSFCHHFHAFVCCCSSQNFKVTGVGIEDLTIEFPWTPYLGHHEGEAAAAVPFQQTG
jgi:hypothetical protein